MCSAASQGGHPSGADGVTAQQMAEDRGGDPGARANLTPLFSVIVTAEDASVCKPAPDCYLAGLTKLNDRRQHERELPLLASECLAIEDSPPGIQSARAAGMRTLGVTNTVSEEALRAAGADVVTRSLADWNVDAVKLVFRQD